MELDDRFVRWQGQAITQLSFTVNLFAGFSVGALAYVLSYLREPTFTPQGCYAILYIASLVLLLVSVVLAVGMVISRVIDFRATAQVVRSRQESATPQAIAELSNTANLLGKATWRFFWGMLGTFGLGIATFTASLVSVYASRILQGAAL
ncbi:hypothetical protein [Ramlibacter humi]|uniref:Uncharacterized protein n=1 Tax=Ramlibacter humi TaxID=2530451 RepID=A0A4Z0BB50_9BURK|nr:hypothetical protein [Ramlibacter humi]TFY96325.1 hypothetical protein EZ216_20505 [Ramlibacter humi]